MPDVQTRGPTAGSKLIRRPVNGASEDWHDTGLRVVRAAALTPATPLSKHRRTIFESFVGGDGVRVRIPNFDTGFDPSPLAVW